MVSRKFNIKRLIMSMLLVMGLCVGLVPAGTAFADAPHYPLEYSTRFFGQHICVLQHSEATEWPVATAVANFNPVSNVDLVTRTEAQGCGTYDMTQILHVRDGNFGSTGPCTQLTGTLTIYAGPYFNYIWAYQSDGSYKSVTAYMNNANPSCRDTSTKRANITSKAIGRALGLDVFTAQVGYPSVMLNSAYSNARVPWATGYDRNGLYYLYSQKLD